MLLRRPEHDVNEALGRDRSEITYDVPHVSSAALPGMMASTLNQRLLREGLFGRSEVQPTAYSAHTPHGRDEEEEPPVPPASRHQGEPACLPLSPSPPLPATPPPPSNRRPWSELSHAFGIPRSPLPRASQFPPRRLPPSSGCARSRTQGRATGSAIWRARPTSSRRRRGCRARSPRAPRRSRRSGLENAVHPDRGHRPSTSICHLEAPPRQRSLPHAQPQQLAS